MARENEPIIMAKKTLTTAPASANCGRGLSDWKDAVDKDLTMAGINEGGTKRESLMLPNQLDFHSFEVDEGLT